MNGGVGGNGEPLSCGAPGKFQKQVLERFRQQLLQRFLSLHDAFSRLNHDVSRDKALTRKEFHAALMHLGAGQEASDDIFDAMDTHRDGGVTLSEFLHALVDVSPEALLWELRCRLLKFNINPHNLHKALELVRWPQHGWLSRATKVKRRSMRRMCACCAAGTCDCHPGRGAGEGDARREAGGEAAAAAFPGLPGGSNLALWGESRPSSAPTTPVGEEVSSDALRTKKPSPYHLTRGDWLKLCTSIYLTLLEAERLWKCLEDKKGFVDLRAMFETLRTTVEPDISLERFVIKACARHDSLEAAFAAFCEVKGFMSDNREPCLYKEGFQSLAVSLNVNDRNAAELWKVLSGSVEAVADALNEGRGECVTLGVFARELSLWAPDTALAQLKENLCNRFGSLGESHRVLQSKIANTEDLSPRELETRLRAAGIKNCDVSKALSTIPAKDGHVSLDCAIDSMRAMKSHAGKSATDLSKTSQTAVRNQTQQLWEQLRSMQQDCQRRYDDDGDGRVPAVSSTAPVAPGRTAKLLPLEPEDQSKFIQSIHGAVRSAETFRSKSVLHQAHRQVLNLERRWAGTPRGEPPPLAAGAGLASAAALGSTPPPAAPASPSPARSTRALSLVASQSCQNLVRRSSCATLASALPPAAVIAAAVQ